MTILDASVMTFDQPLAWEWLIQFCILATALLLGNALRTQVPFLKKSLLPSALLGGVLLLIFKAFPGCRELVNKSMMEIVTYHALVHVSLSILVSSVCMPSSGIAGSYGNSVFRF